MNTNQITVKVLDLWQDADFWNATDKDFHIGDFLSDEREENEYYFDDFADIVKKICQEYGLKTYFYDTGYGMTLGLTADGAGFSIYVNEAEPTVVDIKLELVLELSAREMKNLFGF